MKIFKEYKALAAKAAIWAGIFLFEALLAWWESSGEALLGFWSHFLKKFLLPTFPFLILFTIHDLFVAPMLIHRKRVVPYLLCTVVLMGVFSFYMLGSEELFDGRPEPMERHGQNPPPPHGFMEDRG